MTTATFITMPLAFDAAPNGPTGKHVLVRHDAIIDIREAGEKICTVAWHVGNQMRLATVAWAAEYLEQTIYDTARDDARHPHHH